MLEQQVLGDNFSNKIFYSDEGPFTLDGYVNKQNRRIWGSENPQVILTAKNQHSSNYGRNTAQYVSKSGRKSP